MAFWSRFGIRKCPYYNLNSFWTQIYPKCGPLGVPIHDFGVLSALVHSKLPLKGGFDEI